MNKKHSYRAVIFSCLGMIALILDSKTALQGAMEGVELCIQTVIPSLFPFFVCSIWLTSALNGRKIPSLHPLRKLFHIPQGAGSLLLIGFLGGYPVGAQCVAQAKRSGQITPSTARRMLTFSSNAGPAFLFGIGSRVLPQIWMCWALWAIIIMSSCIVANLTPGKSDPVSQTVEATAFTLSDALRRGLEICAIVCGWVVLFRILICFASRWVLWILPPSIQILVCGLTELANGCTLLTQIEQTGLKFTLFAILLSFGGICVIMQTLSVTKGVDNSLYLPGKILQAMISGLLCVPIQWLLPEQERFYLPAPIMLLGILLCIRYGIFLRKPQKTVAFFAHLKYNQEKYI